MPRQPAGLRRAPAGRNRGRSLGCGNRAAAGILGYQPARLVGAAHRPGSLAHQQPRVIVPRYPRACRQIAKLLVN